MDADVELRVLVPRVLGVLVGRGADFATAEDAVQEALIRALGAWRSSPPTDPTGWLITVAWRAFLDLTRSENARRTGRSGSTRNLQPAPSRTSTTPSSCTSCALTRT